MEIGGNSEQETRSGKNLLKNTSTNTTVNGLTFTINEDKSVKVNGTATMLTDFSIGYVDFKANTKYMLSGTENGGVGKWFLSIRGYGNDIGQGLLYEPAENINKEVFIRVYSGVTCTNQTFKPMVEEGSTATDYEQYGVSPSLDYPSEIKAVGDNVNLFPKGSDFTNSGSKISFDDESNTYTIEASENWKKYTHTGLKSRENVVISFDIKSDSSALIGQCLRIDNSAGAIIGINEKDYTNSEFKRYYYIVTVPADGVINLNMRNNLGIKYYIRNIKIEEGLVPTPYSPYGQGCITEIISNKNLCDNSKVELIDVRGNGTYRAGIDLGKLSVGTYYVSRNDKTKKGILFLTQVINGVYQDYETSGIEFSFTITEPCRCFIRASFNSLNMWTDSFGEVQIEKGNVATSYEEHKEQVYTLPTQQSMRSIGDIRDTFIKINNKWYERHYINRLVLNGTENWRYQENSVYRYNLLLDNIINDVSFANKKVVSSNYFISLNFNDRNDVNNYNERIYGIENGISGHNAIQINSTKFKTVTQYINFLAEQYKAGTPVYVDYVLETPQDIECTKEQSTVLEELSYATTYSEITHIYSPDSIAPVLKTTCGSEIVPIGKFTIQKPNNEEVKEKTTFIGYDYMSKFDVTYIDDGIYPIKLYDKLKKICQQVGVELGTKEIINGDYEILGNPFTNNETCKTVLSNIAQLACGFAKIGRDNKLYIITLSNKNNINEELKSNNYMEDFSKNDIWGEVNSLIIRLSQIEGENTTKQDDESIQKNGLTEITISDNYFLTDSGEREKVIQAIWENIKGLKYLPFSTTYYGFPYLDVGDMIKVFDTKDNEYVSYIFNHEFIYNGSYSGTLETKALTKTQTALKNTNNIKTKFKNVEYKVNKIDGQISAIIEQQTENEEKITQAQQDIDGFSQKVATKDELTEKVNELKQTIDGITAQTKETGGNNIFFYAKEYWHGSTQNSDATLEEYTNTLIQQNNVSDEGYLINNGISVQSQVVKNGQYVISFNYYKLKSDATGYIKVNDIEYKLDGNVNTWNEKIIPITVTSNSIKIELGSDTVASYYISDLMVTTGTEKSIWTQNPNETRTDTVEIGKGLKIKSSTKNTELKADADGVRVVSTNTNKIVSEFTDKGMETDEIIVRGKAQISSLLIQEVNGQVWITGIGG